METQFPTSLPMQRWFWQIRVQDPLTLPRYAGSLLRGAFGHALRRTACVTRQPNCTNCPLQQSCTYSYLFETPVPPEMRILRRYPSAPHPLVIEVPWGGRSLSPGETFVFSMVVMGRALHTLPLISLAWARACADGLGGNRARAELVGYRSEEELEWRDPMAATGYPSGKIDVPSSPESSVLLRFITPFRARKEGVLCSPKDLRFREFLAHLQRRWGLLQAFHGTGWEWDYEGALKQADSMAWEPLDARWVDWTRYSSRQKQTMKLGGVLGTYRIPAETVTAFWPLLYLGQWTHVGKNASFGLGQYRLSQE